MSIGCVPARLALGLLAAALLSVSLSDNGAWPGTSPAVADEFRVETTTEGSEQVERAYDVEGNLVRVSRTTKEGDVEVTRNYDDKNNLVSRVEKMKQGENTTAEYTYDANGARVQVTRTTVETHPTDSTRERTTTETRKYRPGAGKPYEVTVKVEETGLMNLPEEAWARRVLRSSTKTETFDGTPRTRTSSVEEKWRLKEIDDHGVPVYEGRRVTTDAEGNTKVEVFDQKQNGWVPAPQQAEAPSEDPGVGMAEPDDWGTPASDGSGPPRNGFAAVVGSTLGLVACEHPTRPCEARRRSERPDNGAGGLGPRHGERDRNDTGESDHEGGSSPP